MWSQGAILDGNVRRVLARHEAIEGWPGQAETLRKLWAISESVTPEARVADFNQAMMDLGSLICTPKSPTCGECPLKTTCLAYREDNPSRYPGRKPARAIPTRKAFWLILRKPSGRIYLEQRPGRGIWGGLLSPPEFETQEALEAFCMAHFGQGISWVLLPERRHTFSHFHLDFLPVLSDIDEDAVAPLALNGRFLAQDQIGAIPTPVRKLLEDVPLQTQFAAP